MEKEENKNSGSVYVTADKDGKPVHISTKGEGNEGLMDFMFEDVEKALHRKEISTEGIVQYNVPDLSLVPPLVEGKNEDYLQRLEKAMDEQGIMPHRNLRISEVILCLWNDTDPLSKDEQYTRILKPNTWQEIINSPHIPEMLEDLGQGNKYYMGVEVEKGVLLFGKDSFGQHQSNNYLQRNIEEPFFDPDFKGKTLTVYELRSWPSLMEGKINLCGDKYGMALLLKRFLKMLTSKNRLGEMSPIPKCIIWLPHGRITMN